MLKVTVLFGDAYPSGNVTTQRVHNICRGLYEAGADVEVVLAKATERRERLRNSCAMGQHQGVRYRYLTGTPVRSDSLVRGLWQAFVGRFRSLSLAFSLPRAEHVLMIIGPSLDYRVAVAVVARICGVKTVLEINEYPFVNVRPKWLAGFKRSILLRVVFRLYDGFVAISDELTRMVHTVKKKGALVVTVPILSSLESRDGAEQSPMEGPYIVHAGSLIESKDGVQGLVEALAEARKRGAGDLRLVITGNARGSSGLDDVLSKARRLGVEDAIVLPGYLEQAEFAAVLSGAVAGVVNKSETEQNRYCFATKIAEYLSHGVPTISTAVGESVRFLKDGETAYLVPPGDSGQLAEKIVWVLQNPEARQRVGESGRALCEKAFSYRVHGKRLVEFAREVAGGKLSEEGALGVGVRGG